MISLENSIWINAIVILILCFAFYKFISNRKSSNNKKIILSIISVFVIFSLSSISIFSWWQYKSKKLNFKVIKPKIIEVKSLSDLENKKYLVNVVIPFNLKKEQVKSVIKKTNNYVKSKLPKASVIWLAVYNKSLPKEEFYAKKDNPYFVCLAQWARSDYTGFFSKDFKNPENYKGIEIFWTK